jgi:hypothetical protein
VWNSRSVEAWFSGSYWGFTKTLLRKVERTRLDEAMRVGLAQSELPPNGHLTMICVMTRGQVKRFLSHEQLLEIFPSIHANFRQEGVIPHPYRHEPPVDWKPRISNGEATPTFVEIFVSSTRVNLTLSDPWILELFAMYWDYSHHYSNDAKNLLRVVMYEGDRRVPVQILVEDVRNHNPPLYAVLKQFTSLVQPGL